MHRTPPPSGAPGGLHCAPGAHHRGVHTPRLVRTMPGTPTRWCAPRYGSARPLCAPPTGPTHGDGGSHFRAHSGAHPTWSGECKTSSARAPGAHGAVHRAHPERECTTSSERRAVRWAGALHPVRAADAGLSRTHRRRCRRGRVGRHGFGRPPGYCRERRRAGGGFGAGYRAARSRTASVSCSRRSRNSGERCSGTGSIMRASVLGCWTPCTLAPLRHLQGVGVGRVPTGAPATSSPVPRDGARRWPGVPGAIRADAHGRPARGRRGVGQLCCMALRSCSVSSFVPRSAALLWVQVRIAGCACSYGAPAAVFWPSVSATWVR